MHLSDLFKLDEKGLNKLSKDEIIKSIITYKYQYTSLTKSVEDLKNQVNVLTAPYDQLKVLLISVTDYPVEVDDYYKKPKLDTVSLNTLVGCLLKGRNANQ